MSLGARAAEFVDHVFVRHAPELTFFGVLLLVWCAHFTCIFTPSRRLRPRLWLDPYSEDGHGEGCDARREAGPNLIS